MRNSVTTAPVASEALTKFRTPRKKKLKEMSNVFTPQSQPVTKPQQPSNSPHKRKSNNKNDKGLKWFKGTHKKSSQKFRLLKSTAEDFHPPPPSSIAAKVVEFEIDGTVERLGVTERLDILDKESLSAELLVDLSAKLSEELANTNSPSVGRKPRIKSDKVKVKSKKNGKVQTPSIDARLKDTSTTADVALPEPSFRILEDSEELGVFDRPNAYIRYMEATQEELSDEVEYDLEEEDIQWLQLTNAARKKHGVAPVKERDMEFMMDRLEKESYFQMQSTGMDHGPPIDDDAVCCICMDGECQNSNAILFCDMCNLAVHQDCYGVPYIPEGQWLCRKCLHSPSRAVECVLCPNKGGALKGTDDGRWAHVACAIWIPEVCFANTVFLEPIESISNIPAARWRLTCFICKQKGIGACIQCYKSSCYTAFHVTCAQQANLVMKMETVREMHMTSVIIKKTAYCNNHAPPELLLEKKMKDGQETSSPRMKMKQTRKILAEKRDAIPAVLIPTIPKNRIAAISNSVNFPGKPAFMKKLMAYWKLKRNQRNGVPLLRRLQMASTAPNSKPSESFKPKTRVEQEEQMDHYKSWVRLRQDLERARLLCEMIRKREKLKRELIYVKVKLAELELCPMKVFFLNILDEIGNRDTKEIFHHPVDVEEVNDYLTKVKHPMDLSTMRSKVNVMEYTSLEGLEGDFNLMIANCLLYNDKDTVYYKTALRIRAFGAILFRKAKKTFQRIGYDGDTGLHCMPGLVKPPPPAAPTTKTTPTKAMSKATPTKAASAVVTPTKVTSIPTPTKGASTLVTPTKATSIPTLTKTVSTTATPSKATPSKATPTKGTPTKSSPNKGTPSKTTPTKGTPKASSPPKATSIICSELVTCKCSNSSVCNNNCKKNSVTSVTALPLIIPASFTTYRSGGGGVDSDSDDETNRTKGKGLGEDDELEESESESCSGSSSRSFSSASGSDAEDEKRLGESDAEEEDEVRSGESDAEEKSDESDASSIKDKREDQDETYSLSETSDEDTTPVRNTRKQEGVVTRRTSCQQMKASEARTRRGSSSDESDEEIERIRAKTKTRTSGVITRNSNHQVEPMSTPPPRRRRSLVRNSVSTSVVRSPSITSLPFLRRPPPPRPQANDSDGDSSSASSSSASSRTGKDEDDEDEPRKKRLRKRK